MRYGSAPPTEAGAASTGTISIVASGLWVSLLPARAYEVAYTPSTPVIGFAFDPQEGWHSFASDRRRPFRRAPNSLALTPAGCDVFSRSEAGGEYLTISASPDHLAALAEAGRSGLDQRRSDVASREALDIAGALRRTLMLSPGNVLVIEELATRLCRSALARPAPPDASASSLTPQRRRMLEDYIEANLDRPLSIGELAGLVGLSSGFFIRAFKAGLGEPPHAFLRSRRLARTRGLLEAGAGGIAEIAAAAGFASHAHLTAAFTRQFGLSPSAYRRAISARGARAHGTAP